VGIQFVSRSADPDVHGHRRLRATAHRALLPLPARTHLALPHGADHLATWLERSAYTRPGGSALERLRQVDAEHLVYEAAKPGQGGDPQAHTAPDYQFDQRIAW